MKISYGWKICILLFFSTTINYLDRHVLSILAPELQHLYHWSEVEYSYIVTAFQVSYGLGVVLTGKLLDKFGTKWIFAIGVALWSAAGMAHAFAKGAIGFGMARFSLGLGESVNFPASVKTVAELFPASQRAFATGFFNAGSNIGAIVAPLLIPFIAYRFGWQWAFILTGALGFIWVFFWSITYKKPAEIKSAAVQTAEIQDEVPAKSWKQVVFQKEVWAICLVRFISDPTWWFLLYWLPKFLNETKAVSTGALGWPLVTVYVLADIGSLAGGAYSSHLIRKGKGVYAARKQALLICAVIALLLCGVGFTDNLWMAVALIGLGAAAHCGWTANLFATITDVFPKKEVGTVMGVATLSAVSGGIVLSLLTGRILALTGSYSSIFMLVGCTYLLGYFLLNRLIPAIKTNQS
ncbi:MFS transporter [Pedobacter sp. MC2016-24]|uniref:MFS transporter n=1 Tax=Pedobacter sp. MC2016-24 TaxID=2780090 RepID=UPI00187F7B61|nr:MFS transporter [Pedobacter sp. MC2016-24]MBE9598430.1 MFS transporter [Pedobacter sp. MC2016-24]